MILEGQKKIQKRQLGHHQAGESFEDQTESVEVDMKVKETQEGEHGRSRTEDEDDLVQQHSQGHDQKYGQGIKEIQDNIHYIYFQNNSVQTGKHFQILR